MDAPGDAVRAAQHGRLRREWVAVDAPDTRVGAAVEWAKPWLHRFGGDSVRAPAGHAAEDGAGAVLATLACGGFDEARRTLARLDPDAPGCLDLVARYLAWTGDVAFIRARRDSLRRACATTEVVPAGLIAVAESIGDHALAMELRRRTPALVAIDGAPPRAPAVDPAAPEGPPVTRWASLGADALAAAIARWNRHVARAADRADPDGEADAPDAVRTAIEVVLPLIHGMLGAEPDAVRGRLQLSTWIPADWDRLEVLRLRMGDAAVALRYDRDGARHTFRIEQHSGAIPIRLILEAALPGRRLLAARVEGTEAELDPVPAGERLRIPVQLALDHERTLEFHVAAV
ncbi:MAG TPA: hypothetical protein VF188_00550 [Longimicrobiales bacterium]